MPCHTHLKWQYQFEETFDLYLQETNQLYSSHFPWVIFLLQRYCELVLDTLGMSDYAHQKWYYQFIENLHVYLQAKNQFHLPCFSEDCQYFGQ